MQGDSAENKARALRLARYMATLVARKRRAGGDDLICALIAQQEGDDRLSNRELVTLALSLLMAGYETTVDQLSLCILTLLVNAYDDGLSTGALRNFIPGMLGGPWRACDIFSHEKAGG